MNSATTETTTTDPGVTPACVETNEHKGCAFCGRRVTYDMTGKVRQERHYACEAALRARDASTTIEIAMFRRIDGLAYRQDLTDRRLAAVEHDSELFENLSERLEDLERAGRRRWLSPGAIVDRVRRAVDVLQVRRAVDVLRGDA